MGDQAGSVDCGGVVAGGGLGFGGGVGQLGVELSEGDGEVGSGVECRGGLRFGGGFGQDFDEAFAEPKGSRWSGVGFKEGVEEFVAEGGQE